MGAFFNDPGSPLESCCLNPQVLAYTLPLASSPSGAARAAASQKPDEFYRCREEMSRSRGMECGYKYAEAFIRHVQNPHNALPMNA